MALTHPKYARVHTFIFYTMKTLHLFSNYISFKILHIFLKDSLTVKNQWELLTGDDGDAFGVFISLTLLLANLQTDSVNYVMQGLYFTY